MGRDKLDLVVIFEKYDDFFAKYPKQGLCATRRLFSVGCGEESKQEHILINLIQVKSLTDNSHNCQSI